MATPTSKVISPSRRERIPSPEHITRKQEQQELQGLNDRLANYIDRVRFLEAENSRLSTEVQSIEVWRREATALKDLYEKKLAEVRLLLDETAKDKARFQIEANKYKAECQDMLAKFEHRDRDATAAERHVEALEAQVSELLAKLSDAEGPCKRLEKEKSNAGHPMRVNDLETQLAQERDEFRLRMTQKDDELADLRLSLEKQMAEYSDLLDMKIYQDREIDAYRKLLELEETRLNISLDSSQTSQTSQSSRSPGRSTPMRGAKRKRVDSSETVQEFSERSASSGYARSASTKGGIDITEVDPEGKFIKLTNTTSKDIRVGAWHLKHVAGEQETTFKFHRSLVVKAGSTVTVWSADSETPHKPPNDIVMKGKQWFVAQEMKTMLLNTDEEEMASCTMSESSLRSVSTYSQHRLGPHDELDAGEVPHDELDAGEVLHDELDAGEVPHDELDAKAGPDGKKCAVM